MKNGIMVLCTNYKFLEVMLRNLPQEIEGIPLIIILENRLKQTPTKQKVELLCESLEIENFRIINATQIVKWFKTESGLNNDFIDNYTMGMNILAQAFIFSKSKIPGVLFVDDDVIFSEGIAKALRLNKSQFKYYRLSAGPSHYEQMSSEGKKGFDELARVTNFKGEYEDYIKSHLSSGNRFLHRSDFDIEMYMGFLKQFFTSKYFEEKWRYFKETGKGKMAAWYLDEKFETMAYFTMGIIKFGLEPFVVLETSKAEKLGKGKLLRRPLWHNATCSHKENVLKILLERGEIV